MRKTEKLLQMKRYRLNDAQRLFKSAILDTGYAKRLDLNIDWNSYAQFPDNFNDFGIVKTKGQISSFFDQNEIMCLFAINADNKPVGFWVTEDYECPDDELFSYCPVFIGEDRSWKGCKHLAVKWLPHRLKKHYQSFSMNGYYNRLRTERRILVASIAFLKFAKNLFENPAFSSDTWHDFVVNECIVFLNNRYTHGIPMSYDIRTVEEDEYGCDLCIQFPGSRYKSFISSAHRDKECMKLQFVRNAIICLLNHFSHDDELITKNALNQMFNRKLKLFAPEFPDRIFK